MTKTLAQETGTFLANRAAQAKALKQALDNEPEGIRKEQLRAQYEEAKLWAPGGAYRQVLTAVTLATSGNVTGGAGELVQAAAVNYLQGLGAAKIKEIAPLLGGEGSAGHIALHALLGCAGAASKSTGCGGGAAGASAGIVVSQLMDQAFGKPASKLDPIEREARINLVTNLLAGMTAVLDPKAVAAVNDAARLELENNQLALPGAGMAASGGAIAGAGGRGTRPGNSASRLPGSGTGYELGPTENIALQLTRALNALFGADSGPEEATGPLVTPAVPPGGNTSVPGYPGDSQQAGRTPGYELDQGNLGTPGLQADTNNYQGGSVTPLPEQQGPHLILSEATENSLPENVSQLSHIFRDDVGHLPNTPENKLFLLNLVNNPRNHLGPDSRGNQWYAQTLPNGTQLWASVRNGIVRNGGLNVAPKPYNPATGLSKER